MMMLAYSPGPSTHGGKVIPAASHNVIASGKKPSIMGDYHVCPRKGHGLKRVISRGFVTFNGKPHTLMMDRCGCGAAVLGACAGVFSD